MGSISRDDVADLGRTTRLAPRVRDFIGRPGFQHRQEVNPKTGRVEDVVTWKPHDGHGNLTPAAKEVMASLAPFVRADGERWKGLESRRERVSVVDEAGACHHLEPHVLETQRSRWHSPGRITGILATEPQGDFCPICDRRASWCECTRGTR